MPLHRQPIPRMNSMPETSQSQLATAQRLLNNALEREAQNRKAGPSACSPDMVDAVELSSPLTHASLGKSPSGACTKPTTKKTTNEKTRRHRGDSRSQQVFHEGCPRGLELDLNHPYRPAAHMEKRPTRRRAPRKIPGCVKRLHPFPQSRALGSNLIV